MRAARAGIAATVRALAVLGVCATAALLGPGTARAGDTENFQAALALYDAHDWQGAIRAFESLVGGEVPTLRSRALVLESRKYLAAAYVFDGNEGAASFELERLLTEDPSYQLDETQFPREFVQLFARVQTRLAEQSAREAERARLEAEVQRLRDENASMRAALSAERSIEVPRSQWLMLIPFGVGQFENGEEGMGWFFAVTEALLAAGMAATLIAHQAVIASIQSARMGVRMDDWARANDVLDVLEVVSWSSAGLFGAFIAAGIIQANVAFSPTRTVRVPAPTVSVRLGPGLTILGTF